MYISLEERIYGLSLIWKEATYNFAYWDERPELDWDKAYNEYLPKVMAAENPYEYYRLLQRFISLLRDGHTFVVMPEGLVNYSGYLPIVTSFIEGKHVLFQVPAVCKQHLYAEVISVNGKLLEEYLAEYILPYFWHENTAALFAHSLLSAEILRLEQSEITIGITLESFHFIRAIISKHAAGIGCTA